MDVTSGTGSVFDRIPEPDLVLGGHGLEFELDSRADVAAITERLAAQASRSLYLHTEDLDATVYDRLPFLDAVSRLVRGHARAQVLILVQDSGTALRSGHRLIELYRRLSTAIRIHRPAPEYRNFHETFLLADSCGYLYRRNPGRYEGVASFNDPGKVAEWRKYFMEVWERSEPDSQLLRLHL